ncbi:MAG TPA: hypothetical protein PKD00_03735 [Burkholderiales bacterium]|nr:hypothetical protein [Burkholderiales bacterium]
MFKTQVDNDILLAFLNLDEFAETNIINGVSMVSIIDESINHEYKRTMQYDADGVFIETISLFVKKSDLGYIPAINEQMIINKSRYYIINVIESMGILEIKLREYIA